MTNPDDPRLLPKDRQGQTPPQFESTPSGGRTAAGAGARAGGGPPVPPGFGLPEGTGVPAGFLRTVPQPLVVKPPVGMDFIEGGNLTGVNIAASPAPFIGGGGFRVPLGSVGFVRSIFVQVNGLLATSLITFSLKVDSQPVPGFGSIIVPAATLGVFALSYGPDEVFVQVRPGGLIQLDATVTAPDAAAYAMSGVVHGWTVPAGMASAFELGWG